ncbi:MAG: NMP kinase [Thermoplasmata archaeon]|nr:MAG: NMP kinase [Thermoplasmata archaeon]
MKIALTGTPGTGKTSVAELLRKKGYKVERFDEIGKDYIIGYDKERGCNIVDVESIDNIFSKKKEKGILFIEGHLSHLLSVDIAIILRCNPYELEKRLKKKGWNKRKIMENVEAEALDIILCQACNIHGEESVFEIDTTGKKTEEVVMELEKMIKKGFKEKQKRVDWSEWLMENAGQI